jgi:heptose I phosphotransferase
VSESFWQRLTGRVRRVFQRRDWVRFAGDGWADRIMDVTVTDHFHAKQGRSTGRLVLQNGDERLTVYLKRHYRLPWWQGLLATLWPNIGWSPALREWRQLEWARAEGLPVPATVAAGEFIGPCARLQSFLAVEELTGMVPLHEAIPAAAGRLSPGRFRRWKRTLLAELARVVRALHDRRRFHKDLYLCHFFIPNDDSGDVGQISNPSYWRGRVYLIDLHRLAHHPRTPWLPRVKDLAQLLYSSEIEGVDFRDRLCFWKSYLGPEWCGRGERWLRRLVLFKWRRYRRHNARVQARVAPSSRKEGWAA